MPFVTIAIRQHFYLVKVRLLFHILLGINLLVVSGQEPPDTNYDESKVPKYTLPNPLVCFDGRSVTNAAIWRVVRRPEILQAFATNIYGRTLPVQTHLRYETTRIEPSALDGLAIRKEITLEKRSNLLPLLSNRFISIFI